MNKLVATNYQSRRALVDLDVTLKEKKQLFEWDPLEMLITPDSKYFNVVVVFDVLTHQIKIAGCNGFC